MKNRTFIQPLAIMLCTLLAGPAVSPLGAAESAAVLGRVVAAAPAQLNGVTLPGDGTLMSGDRLSTGPSGWARVFLPGGEQIHLGAQSAAQAARQGGLLAVELTQGRVALRTHKRDWVVRSNGLEITPGGASAVWEVARLGNNLTQVASQQGTLEVRASNRTVQILPGQSLQLQTRLLETEQQPGGAGSGAGMSATAKTVLALVIIGGLAAGIAIPVALASNNEVVSPSVP